MGVDSYTEWMNSAPFGAVVSISGSEMITVAVDHKLRESEHDRLFSNVRDEAKHALGMK